jgi:hypothetical protein
MYVFAKPSWTPEKDDATETFRPQEFSRFDTPETGRLRALAFFVTATGALLLIAFFLVQKGLPQPARVAYCVAAVLALAAFGAWMTRRPALASQPLAQGPSHA